MDSATVPRPRMTSHDASAALSLTRYGRDTRLLLHPRRMRNDQLMTFFKRPDVQYGKEPSIETFFPGNNQPIP